MKIPKNRADKEMFAGVHEEQTFETMFLDDEAPETPRPKAKSKEKEDLAASFVTKELQEKLGKLLLEMKLDLYKDGLVDYELKVSREGRRVVLTAAPVKRKTARA